MTRFTIGSVAERSGFGVDAIRYYEREGLIGPRRTPAGYRLYGADDLQRLHFIKQAKALGFSLADIRELLSIGIDPHKSCADVQRRARQRIADIDARIAQLERMKSALTQLADACPGSGPASACPILGSLEKDE